MRFLECIPYKLFFVASVIDSQQDYEGSCHNKINKFQWQWHWERTLAPVKLSKPNSDLNAPSLFSLDVTAIPGFAPILEENCS